jgi:hypothetical protein
MTLKLVPLKCPKCGSILKAQRKDLVYQCDNCGTFVYAPTGEVINATILDFEIARGGKKYYMPFLAYHTRTRIYNEDVRGFFADRGMGGEWITYIPAGGSLPTEKVVRISKLFTSNPPNNKNEVQSFRDATPLSLEIPIEEGEKLAEFIFLSYEVDRPGILQNIQYDFQATFEKILYVPVYYDNGYIIALRGYGGE